MNIDKKIQSKIIEIGNKYKDIKKITLFGSRARGDNSDRSDIDLAVYFVDKPNYNVIGDFEEIETLLKIDVTVITNGLEEKFLQNVKNEEIVVYMFKLENKLNNFKKALDKLEVVVKQFDFENDIIRDSLIQRFEFCYELAWKTLKEYLVYNGLLVESMPRAVFKAAYENGVIDNADIWLEMIRDRNIASHEYSEEQANVFAENIVIKYFDEFKGLAMKINISK